MIDVYCLDINNNLPKVKLPKSVELHIKKYSNINFRNVSQLGWSTLINLLENKYKINFNKDQICFKKGGKPYLKSNKLFFSLSHSANLIAIAVSNKPIGVDIQELIPIKLCKIIFKRALNKSELLKYQKAKNKSLFMTKIWAQKESMLKLKGLSIFDISKYENIKTQGNVCEVIDSHNVKYVLAYSK